MLQFESWPGSIPGLKCPGDSAAQKEPGPAKDKLLSVGFLLYSSCSLGVKSHDFSYLEESEDRYRSQVIKRYRDEPVPHRDFICARPDPVGCTLVSAGDEESSVGRGVAALRRLISKVVLFLSLIHI